MAGLFLKKVVMQIKADFHLLENFIKLLKTKKYCDVGILGKETAEQTEEGKTKNISIAYLGAVHEFGADIEVTDKMRAYLHYIGIHLKSSTGSIHIPQRSFILMPLETNEKKITKTVEPKFPLLITENSTDKFLKEMGAACEGVIQEAFDTGGFGTWQDISQMTKDRKDSGNILIDKGGLRQAISSKVGG
jgi:phage gpG-like protein